MTCCCSADVTQLLGSKNKKGLIPIHDILLIARSLLEYGVAGRAKVRISQRNENKSYSSEFKITDYINNARVHLGLSLDDAKKLTMTEYIMLMANKYPDKDGFTREEYDKILENYEKKWQARLVQAAE